MTFSKTVSSSQTSAPLLKPGWSPINLFLMVIGFIFFWPLGLAMLAYCLWGHNLQDVVAQLKRSLNIQADWNVPGSSYSASGNAAFDAYREAELKRLEEERAKLDAMRKEFDDHVESLRRARDQEEFDRFMAKRNQR